MNEKTHHKLKVLSNGIRVFVLGVLVGSSALAIWAKHVDILTDDVRLVFVFMLAAPALVFVSVMPALMIEILDGISKLKSKKEFGSNNN